MCERSVHLRLDHPQRSAQGLRRGDRCVGAGGHATFRNWDTVAGQNRPTRCRYRVEGTAADEDGPQRRGRLESGGDQVPHLRRHERCERGLGLDKGPRVPCHRQRARAGEMAARVNAETADVERWQHRRPDIA